MPKRLEIEVTAEIKSMLLTFRTLYTHFLENKAISTALKQQALENFLNTASSSELQKLLDHLQLRRDIKKQDYSSLPLDAKMVIEVAEELLKKTKGETVSVEVQKIESREWQMFLSALTLIGDKSNSLWEELLRTATDELKLPPKKSEN